jgi:hypothetical protein
VRQYTAACEIRLFERIELGDLAVELRVALRP